MMVGFLFYCINNLKHHDFYKYIIQNIKINRDLNMTKFFTMSKLNLMLQEIFLNNLNSN